jgi:hypothetical protein
MPEFFFTLCRQNAYPERQNTRINTALQEKKRKGKKREKDTEETNQSSDILRCNILKLLRPAALDLTVTSVSGYAKFQHSKQPH